MNWKTFDEIPDVQKGAVKTFLVSFLNIKTNKRYVTTADYLNWYPLDMDTDDCICEREEDHNDGCPSTGWFDSVPSAEYDRFYTPMNLQSHDVKMEAWSNFPKPYKP